MHILHLDVNGNRWNRVDIVVSNETLANIHFALEILYRQTLDHGSTSLLKEEQLEADCRKIAYLRKEAHAYESPQVSSPTQ